MRTRLHAASVVLLALVVGACGDSTPAGGPDSRGRAKAGGLPAYCSTEDGGKDHEFWSLVEQSCRAANDGDVRQARALREVLSGLEADEVEEFDRTFVRLNHGLYTREVAAVAADACGISLGDDLFTDYRSWVMSHGQAAYEAVRARPEVLARFPDVTNGCGAGEPFGYAAFDVYKAKVGGKAALDRLPMLEPVRPPRS